MDSRAYVHEIGARLEASKDSAERVALATLLAATNSSDAEPYLADALAAETDEDAREQIRRILGSQGWSGE
jgi:hypothetical protein